MLLVTFFFIEQTSSICTAGLLWQILYTCHQFNITELVKKFYVVM